MANNNFDWLIAGLGNPGRKYAETRHNIGWMILDKFAEKHYAIFDEASGQCYLAKLKLKNYSILLAKPATYMNNSGQPINWVIKKYNVPKEKLVVIVDEYNFPFGKLHLKNSGSHGGHNGIASIFEILKFDIFYRLRCGIGNDFAPGEMSDYVLSVFKDSELENMNLMIDRAVLSLESIILQGPTTAMTLINSGRLWRPKKEIEKIGEKLT